MKIAGIITAAGMSSRMGDFKPLLTINGLPMALHTVLSMKNAGISPICVVTGHRGDELSAALADSGVIFARNPSPETSDMLASIKLGLSAVSDSDGFFLLPADMPLTAPSTFKTVLDYAVRTKSPYTVPVAGGKKAHPPLIMKECYDSILGFEGDGGLPAALGSFEPAYISAGDTISNLDADYPHEFDGVRRQGMRRLGLSDRLCLDLLSKAGTPDNIKEHCLAVGELAEHIADNLISHGCYIDALLCRSAGSVHDIMRVQPHHSAAGADFLESEGYFGVADVVRRHMTFDGLSNEFDEYTVVCLADKLVSGTARVSPFERYAPASEKYPSGTEIGNRVRRDCGRAFTLYARYVELTGDSLY